MESSADERGGGHHIRQRDVGLFCRPIVKRTRTFVEPEIVSGKILEKRLEHFNGFGRHSLHRTPHPAAVVRLQSCLFARQ